MSSDLQACLLAIKALEDALSAVIAAAHEGMTAEEIDRILDARLAAHDATRVPQSNTPFVVAENGAPPKKRLDRVPYRRGALWAMDNTVRCKGFCADLARYGYFGPVPDVLRCAHRAVLARQDLLAAAIQPHRTVGQIFDAVPHDMPFEIHRIGAEPTMDPVMGNAVPALAQAMDDPARRAQSYVIGQVICVEIWAGMCGGIEDMYVVEPRGVRRLSTLPRDIREVTERSQ